MEMNATFIRIERVNAAFIANRGWLDVHGVEVTSSVG
jgi:hypothetical protein